MARAKNNERWEPLMFAYVNVYLGCLALFLELVALAPLWPEASESVD